jgi:hypothetical protein
MHDDGVGSNNEKWYILREWWDNIIMSGGSNDVVKLTNEHGDGNKEDQGYK